MATCDKIRFCDANLYTGSVTSTYSSQQTSYPASDAKTTVRSDYWSPAGFFEVTDANDTFAINDGSYKLVPMTKATYSTPAAMAAHIQAACNVVSSGWTCTYSTTTNKFTLGNSGTVTLKLSTATPAWDLMGFVGSTDRTGTSFEADLPRNHSYEWLKLDAGFPATVGFVGVIGEHGEEFTLSDDATIKIQANNIDLWDSPPLDTSMTRTAQGVFHNFDSDSLPVYRYWRFYFVDRENPVGPTGFKFSHIYIGDYQTFSTTNVGRGIGRQQVDPTVELQSESGAKYFDLRDPYERFSGLSVAYIEKADRDAVQQIYNDYGKHTPLFVSIDPSESISNNGADHTRLMHFSRDPSFSHIIRDLYTMQFELEEAR